MFQTDERGFIFTFDATLAVLISLVVLAGMAGVGGRGEIYEQHGYLRLERYANDALIVMEHAGVIREVIHLISAGENQRAREVARENLRSILPSEVQFKLMIGGEEKLWLDNVYPGTDNQAWENKFENAEERAVASYITVETVKVVENLDVLIWVDDPKENNFVNMIEKPGWIIKTTDNEKLFRMILENDVYPNWYPDAVFLPDVSTPWSDETIDTLIKYNLVSIEEKGEDIGGGVIGGGETVWNNDTLWMRLMFGVMPWPFGSIDRVKGPEYAPGENEMQIIDTNHYITANFKENENIPYAGDDYYQYQYRSFVSILGQWWINENNIWPGLIAREAYISWRIYNFGERTALFNTRLAQSAFDEVGKSKWIELARRSIEWVAREYPSAEPVTLFVWRG